MGLVMLMALIGLILVSLLLGYLSPLGFWWWFIGVPVALGIISVILRGADEVQESLQETGKDVVEISAPKIEIPRWSYSKFSTTEEIKISLNSDAESNEPPRYLSTKLFAREEEGDDPQYGYRIDYPIPDDGVESDTEGRSRFFLRKLTILPDGQFHNGRRLKTELLYWQGELADVKQAVPLFESVPVQGAEINALEIEGWDIVGIDEDWTLINATYEYHHVRQVFLFDHQQQILIPITERKRMASARVEWGDDFHYMMATCHEKKQVLLTLYDKEKNYDDFFSARGHRLPRISQISLLTEANPTGELVARLKLENQGMVVAIQQQDEQLIINTLDERDTEDKLERQWSLKL